MNLRTAKLGRCKFRKNGFVNREGKRIEEKMKDRTTHNKRRRRIKGESRDKKEKR
jgi:hypothetical protein